MVVSNGIIYFKIIWLCQMRCVLFLFYELLKTLRQKCLFLFLCFSQQAPIPEDREEQLNLILPGCLLPYQKEINKLFFSEKQKFLCNKRFAAVFARTSLNPVIKNKNSLKKLIIKTKIV